MTNTKNNLPPYAEEITLNPKREQIQEVLNKFQQLIPSNFKKLENLKHMCSTQGWKEPVCERYGCSVDGEWRQIDIRHTLLDKLGLLAKVKNIPYPVHISTTALDKGLDHLAYTIENEEEIFLEQSFTIQNLEKNLNKLFQQIEKLEEKEQLNQETITNLKQEIEEVKKLKSIWRNKYLEEKGSNNQELQTQITDLITERDNIQQELTNQQTEIANLQTELTQLNNNLQTTQQARDQIQQSLKRNLISSLLKSKQKVKRINELNNSLSFLRGLLTNNNQEVTNLINEQNNLQIQINDLNQQLIVANNLITNKDNEITRLENEVRNLRAKLDARPDITIEQLNNYRNRPTQQQLNNLQQELNKEKGWWDKWINSRYDNNNSNNDQAKFKIYSGEEIREIYKKVCGNYPTDHYHDNFEHRFSINVLYGTPDTRFQLQECIWDKPNNAKREGRKFIKMIYEYYKNQ